MEFLQRHIREHTDVHRVAHVDAGADAAGNIHIVDELHRHIHALQQGIDGGENGALGTDEIVDVHLVDGDFPLGLTVLGLRKDVSSHAVVVPADPVPFPDKQALGIDDAAAEKLGDNIDDAAAADAHGLLPGVPHDGEGGLHGGFVDGAGLNGAVGGAHTAGDVAALKGRTGGAGAAHQKVPVAEDNFAVGAQVDEQAHLVPVPDAGGQSTGGDIAAHVRADVGRDQHLGQGVGRELHVPGQQPIPVEEAGNIGLHTDGLGIHAHKQMVHGGVGAHAQAEDAPGIKPRRLAQARHNGGQGVLDNGILELFLAAGLALLNDSVDDIRTIANLAVAGGALGQDLAAGQVRHNHGNGGGADIDGAAVDARVFGAANLHAGEGFALQAALDADREIVLPENGRHADHDRMGNLHGLHPQGLFNGPGQALIVRHGIVQAGLCHGEHHAAVGIGKVNAALLQILLGLVKDSDLLGGGQVRRLHPALVGRGNIGDKNGAVPCHLGRAA